MISLADSQVLRWIDELNGIVDSDEQAKSVKREIRSLKKEPQSKESRKRIKSLYDRLDKLQFKPDYMCLIIDKKKDYFRACDGFKINGVEYRRLLGTNGGIKNSTIVFVSLRLVDELRRRIDNGRNPDKALVPAKLEAYRALTCSASTPVSFPDGVIVVSDCETSFMSDVVYLTDESNGEPEMEERKNAEIKMNCTDGFGIMLPSLADRWSTELKLDYVASGMNTRFSFEKGMVFTFDFLDFAENISGRYIVKDAWGTDRDVRDAELILTTSMVKLWDSYDSCEDYISNSIDNGYSFGIAKVCPAVLENERSLNYQFIQSYDLSDEDIDALIKPTSDEFYEITQCDWRKAALFLNGVGLNSDNIDYLDSGISKAIMIDHGVFDDPFVRSSIYSMIKKRIDDAKVGVIKVHGNYSIISGDPFSLCQHIFDMEVTGLLKSGEIYNGYWANEDADYLACYRAPMTCSSNIRKVVPARSDIVRYWYRYMNTCTIFNSWDTSTQALNGADFDGDLVMLTDNPVLVGRLEQRPTLFCVQRNASKKIPNENDLIVSNIASFGNDIGKTTNWVTSMFEVQSHYKKGTVEYDILDYRIQCGQLFQQNAIDKSKGIICKPMPREWHDRQPVSTIQDAEQRALYRSILADKKPYFMRYIYPSLMKKYNTYISNTEKNASRRFGKGIKELTCCSYEDLTEEEREFLQHYDTYMPVGTGDCVMNRICRRFEDRFDSVSYKTSMYADFDYSIYKSGAEYSRAQYNEIARLFAEYKESMKAFISKSNYENMDKSEISGSVRDMRGDFVRRCEIVCPDPRALCDLVIDLCYGKNATKKFAWDMCGEQIIRNLLIRSGYVIEFPEMCETGDIYYCGIPFEIHTKEFARIDEDCYE